MNSPTSTSFPPQDVATPVVEISEIVGEKKMVCQDSVACVPSQDADDTLPTPPATQQFHPAVASAGDAHRWLNVALSDEQTPLDWVLHDTVIEEESDEEGDERRREETLSVAVSAAVAGSSSSHHTASEAEGGVLARVAKSQRPAVLVSPSMTEDFPETNSWMSPARADEVEWQSPHSISMRSQACQSRCVSYADGQADAAERASAKPPCAPRETAASVATAAAANSAPPYVADEALEQHHRSTSHPDAMKTAQLTSPSPTRPAELKEAQLSLASSAEPQRPSVASQPAAAWCTALQVHPTNSSTNTTEEMSATAAKGAALQRLRLQLHQAERAAALQQALREAVQSEKDELQLQFEELLRIQSELERRSQQHEADLAEAAQRHATEKLAWEVERQKEGAQLKASQNEVQVLQLEVADAREELRVLMEDHLSKQEDLLATKSAQAAAEQLCGALKTKLEVASEEVRAAERLAAAVKDAEERAAVSQLAFHTLCDQLASVLKRPSSTSASREGSALSISGLALLSGAMDSPSKNPTTHSTFDVKDMLRTAMSEERVAAAVEAALSQQSVGHHLDSSNPPSRANRAAKITTTNANNNEHGNSSLSAFKVQTAATAASRTTPSVQGDVHILSDACLAMLQQCRQEVQQTLTSVVEQHCRVARDTQAVADTRAAEMERALSAELRQLRAQMEGQKRQQQQLEEAHLERTQRQDVGVEVQLFQQEKNAMDVAEIPRTVAEKPLSTNAADGADTPTAPTLHFSTADPQVLQAACAETQRALLLERRHTALLQAELTELHEAHHTTTLLTSVEQTLHNVHQSIVVLIRDAVVEVRNVGGTWHDSDAMCDSGDGDRREKGHQGRVYERGASRLREHVRPIPTAVFSNGAESRPAASLDGATMECVRRAVLLAEAQVARVGEELLGDIQRDRFAGAVSTLVSAYPRSATVDVSVSQGINQQIKSEKRMPPLASPRSARQQQVYEEMQALLRRSHAEELSQTATQLPSASRYSPDGSRWLAGIHPPPPPAPSSHNSVSRQPQHRCSTPLPSGTIVTPARQTNSGADAINGGPSPYVRAYVHALEETPEDTGAAPSIASHAVFAERHSGARGCASTSPMALRLFEGMATTTQELRNIGDLLELLRDNEMTREGRLQACLLTWEAHIRTAVKEGLSRVQALVTQLRPPNAALEAFQRQRQDRQGVESSSQTPTLPMHIEAAAAAALDSTRRKPAEARLSDVLAGKSAATSGASSTGAVCFPHRK